MNPTDEQQVVATFRDRDGLAFERREHVTQDGRVAESFVERDAFELVVAARGEPMRDVGLARAQNVHREMSCGTKAGCRRRAVVEAPQHERRLERQCRERIDRKTLEATRRAASGHDRDAGGEPAERIAQVPCVVPAGDSDVLVL